MLDLDRVQGHVSFERDAWNRRAFWLAVLLAGVSVGTQWAHPELSFLEAVGIGMTPTAGLAGFVADLSTLLALILLTLIIGAEKIIEE